MDILELTDMSFDKARDILAKMKRERGLSPDEQMYFSFVSVASSSSYAMRGESCSFSSIRGLDVDRFVRMGAWRGRYPDLGRIVDTMECFRTDEMVFEYTKETPPPSIVESAINVYKKCVSYKGKLRKKAHSNLLDD